MRRAGCRALHPAPRGARARGAGADPYKATRTQDSAAAMLRKWAPTAARQEELMRQVAGAWEAARGLASVLGPVGDDAESGAPAAAARAGGGAAAGGAAASAAADDDDTSSSSDGGDSELSDGLGAAAPRDGGGAADHDDGLPDDRIDVTKLWGSLDEVVKDKDEDDADVFGEGDDGTGSKPPKWGKSPFADLMFGSGPAAGGGGGGFHFDDPTADNPGPAAGPFQFHFK